MTTRTFISAALLALSLAACGFTPQEEAQNARFQQLAEADWLECRLFAQTQARGGGFEHMASYNYLQRQCMLVKLARFEGR